MLAQLKRRWKLCSFIAVLAMALAVIPAGGFRSDLVGTTIRGPWPGDIYDSLLPYAGASRLEERIVRADVIARVKLRSVVQTTERLVLKEPDPDDYYFSTVESEGYVVALEFTFDALEYLKGSGGNELKAVAEDRDVIYEKELAASTLGEDFLTDRDKRWDDREAIVFLRKTDELPSTEEADRYRLGALRYAYEEYYTISSRRYQAWLPAAAPSEVGVSALGAMASAAQSQSGGSEQLFLMAEPPEETVVVASGQGKSIEPLMISATDLKLAIAEVEAEVAAAIAAGSAEYTAEEYRMCIFSKYQKERKIFRKLELGDGYYRKQTDVALVSGSASGDHIYWGPTAGIWVDKFGWEEPSEYNGEDWIGGVDGWLFTAGYPVHVTTARPLPRGEYRFYYDGIPNRFSICDGMPELEKKRHELFVTVTSPTGTAHEALFDPVAIGAAVGADSANGTLTPTAFAVGGAGLQSLKWEGGSAILTLSPYASLAGHTLDFIALDGTVSLSLSADSATLDSAAGTLTWTAATQPWSAGDQLMLRIWGASALPTPEPTPTPTPAPTLSPNGPAQSS